jgi:GH35 family endo-1,4-beta-xylanase
MNRSKRFILWTVILLILILAGGAAVILNRGSSSPVVQASIQISSSPWLLNEPAQLSLRLTSPHAGQAITLTVLAPGNKQETAADGNLSSLATRAQDFFGLSGVQLSWLAPLQQELEMELARSSGARFIGMDFDWRQIEPQRGQYDWTQTDRAVDLAKQFGLRLAPMLLFTPLWASTAAFAPLDYQHAPPIHLNDYRDFVYAVVDRYRPHGKSPLTSDGYGISDWVIWNEPNMQLAGISPQPDQFWTGDIEAYIELLRAGYEGAHAADPRCNVLNGGLADLYLQNGGLDLPTAVQKLYDPNGDGNADDGARPYFDTLNVHIYQLAAPDPAWYQQRLAAVLAVMDRFGDKDKKLWITETGYGTASENSTGTEYLDESMQADAVRMVYETTAAYPRVERVFWWSLRDYYINNSAANRAMEAHYGLLRVNFTLKPAYVAYSHLTGSLGQSLNLTTQTDETGLAKVSVPADLISQVGTYIVFINLGDTEAGSVLFYQVSSANPKK